MKEKIQNGNAPPKEGDLYKMIHTFGKIFELRYGYYDEIDRHSAWCEPAIIYPDFICDPIYTDEGEPFVTMMQDACTHFRGNSKRTVDTTCADCLYFVRGEEWFGVCRCQENRKDVICENKIIKSDDGYRNT